MKFMLIVFFVLFLLLLLVLPFKSRIMGHLNLTDKKGFYSFKIWKVKILCGRVYFNDENKLIIENTNNVIKNKYKDKLMQKFARQVMSEIEVKKVELFFTGGFKQNSFSSAMICASARLLMDLIYSYLSQNFFNVKLYEDIEPLFDEDLLELTFDFVATISIFKFIKSLIIAKLKLNKERGYE